MQCSECKKKQDVFLSFQLYQLLSGWDSDDPLRKFKSSIFWATPKRRGLRSSKANKFSYKQISSKAIHLSFYCSCIQKTNHLFTANKSRKKTRRWTMSWFDPTWGPRKHCRSRRQISGTSRKNWGLSKKRFWRRSWSSRRSVCKLKRRRYPGLKRNTQRPKFLKEKGDWHRARNAVPAPEDWDEAC